jgi:hypothetical protein
VGLLSERGTGTDPADPAGADSGEEDLNAILGSNLRVCRALAKGFALRGAPCPLPHLLLHPLPHRLKRFS